MRFPWIGAAGAALFVIVGGCSSQSTSGADKEKTSVASEAIQGGTADTADTYAVGVCGGAKGNCSGFCSGALITPNLVVTARHCIAQSPEQIDCSVNPTFGGQMWNVGTGAGVDLFVTTNASMFGGTATGWHSVKQIVTPPDSHVCGNDLALLILNDLVPNTEAVPIIPGVQYPMDDAQYALKFEAIGYGVTSPQQQGLGQRRIRMRIPIVCIPGSSTYDCPTSDGMGNPININANEFVAGDGTCSGDSGSSAYDDIGYVLGKPVSHGVLSRGGQSSDGLTCIGSLYTRLDTWRDLIVNTANTASGSWTLYPKPSPDWTVYVPPPPKKDAGADGSTSTSGGPTTKPSGKGLGEACTTGSECSSKTCSDPGDGNLVCSAACSDANACPDGYACRDSLCFVSQGGDQTNGATTTNTTSGCSVSRAPADPTKPTPWRALGLAAAALGLAIARRSKKS